MEGTGTKLDGQLLASLRFFWGGPRSLPARQSLGFNQFLRFALNFLFAFLVVWGVISGVSVILREGQPDLLKLFSPGVGQTIFWGAVLATLVAIYLWRVDRRGRTPKLVPGQSVDLAEALSDEAIHTLHQAQVIAADYKATELTADLLMAAIFTQKPSELWLLRMGITKNDILSEIAGRTILLPESNQLRVSDETLEILKQAFILSVNYGTGQIHNSDLWYAVTQLNPSWQNFFGRFDLDEGDTKQMYLWHTLASQRYQGGHAAILRPHRNLNRDWTARPTPTLERFSRNLTELIRVGGMPHIEAREEEANKAIEILIRAHKNSLILTGPPGAGKSLVVAKIAQRIANRTAPAELWDRKLISIDTAKMISEAASLGGLPAALSKIISEAVQSGNTILFIPDTHMLTGSTEGGMNLAGVISSIIGQPGFQFIGTTTPAYYTSAIESNPQLEYLIDRVDVVPLQAEASLTEVLRQSQSIEGTTGVLLTLAAVKEAIKISDEYQPSDVLPGKAVRLLDSAASHNRTLNKWILTPEDIIKVAEETYKVPIRTANTEESAQLLDLENALHKDLVDQVEAVKQVSDSLRRGRAGLHEGNRPIGSFLFVGPTGVGKTELAKALARVYFGDENKMVRLDMSEFQSPDSVNRLIGSTGSKEGGYFTEMVRNQPFSLILLDEFEKASQNVLDLFLQILEDGRLTDSRGEVVSFKQTIIIATSNASANLIADSIQSGMGYDDLKQTVVNDLKNQLRIELINRFDDVIVFKPLTPDELTEIVKLMIAKVNRTLAPKKITLKLDDEAVKKIAILGYDPAFGARPLRRVIQDKIEAPLATAILAGRVKPGDEVSVSASELD